MNILHIHQKFYPYLGGSTHRLLNLVDNLDKNKFKIIVISEWMEGNALKEYYKGIEIYRYKKFYEIPFLILKICRKKEINIIHSHNYRPSLFACITNIFLKKKLIVEMHSIYETKGLIKNMLGKFILKAANLIIVLSETSKEYLIKNYNLYGKKIRIVYNGINLEYYNKNKKENRNFIPFKELREKNKSKLFVGYMGSLHFFQGITNLIEIINENKNDNIFFFIIGGNIEEVEKLKDKIKRQNVFLHPFIKKEETFVVYKEMDILLIPRPKILSTQTAIPLKPLEALAMGKLVLGTRVGGLMELENILKSKNFILKDLEEIKNYLDNLSSSNKLSPDLNIDNIKIFDVKKQSYNLENIYYELEGENEKNNKKI